MILYNLPIVLCVLLVMCFQTNFFFNSVFDKSARKTNRIVYFIIYGLLCFMYLVIPMNSYIASCVALLMIFGLAQSYDVEIKTKVIFSILYAVLMTMVSFISLYIFSSLDSIDFTTLDSGNGQDRLTFTKALILSCVIMFAVIQVIRFISKRRSFSLPYRYYIFFLIVP